MKERKNKRKNDTHSGFLILEVISRWLHHLALLKTVTKLSMSVIYWDYINHISVIYVRCLYLAHIEMGIFITEHRLIQLINIK